MKWRNIVKCTQSTPEARAEFSRNCDLRCWIRAKIHLTPDLINMSWNNWFSRVQFLKNKTTPWAWFGLCRYIRKTESEPQSSFVLPFHIEIVNAAHAKNHGIQQRKATATHPKAGSPSNSSKTGIGTQSRSEKRSTSAPPHPVFWNIVVVVLVPSSISIPSSIHSISAGVKCAIQGCRTSQSNSCH